MTIEFNISELVQMTIFILNRQFLFFVANLSNQGRKNLAYLSKSRISKYFSYHEIQLLKKTKQQVIKTKQQLFLKKHFSLCRLLCLIAGIVGSIFLFRLFAFLRSSCIHPFFQRISVNFAKTVAVIPPLKGRFS